jgi:hypothetical protein
MDNASAQIEELKQEVALLRKHLAQSDARMLTCLVRSNAEILACQIELAMFRDAIAKDTAHAAADRRKRHDIVVEEMNALWKNNQAINDLIIEIHLFLWPVVEKVFPSLLTKYAAVGQRFKATGTYSESKPH